MKNVNASMKWGKTTNNQMPHATYTTDLELCKRKKLECPLAPEFFT